MNDDTQMLNPGVGKYQEGKARGDYVPFRRSRSLRACANTIIQWCFLYILVVVVLTGLQLNMWHTW